MDEMIEKFSPSVREYLKIAETLADTINNINEVYNETTKEMVTVWNKLKN